jgi:FMN phosphatase YigB (HAD superfamily)
MRILTDCDGVLLNWEYAFGTWMERHGYKTYPDDIGKVYDVSEIYNIPKEEKNKLIRFFNESAAIGYLPPLRDAMYYVDKLHREFGAVFHVITSLSNDPSAQKLRKKNLTKLFGDTVFEKFVFLDTGADKHEALEAYRNSGDLWIEDKIENAEVGRSYGLNSILVEHGHNMHCKDFPLMKNWKDIYEYVSGK